MNKNKVSRPKVSTGTGDDGTTGLWGGGRVDKTDVIIEALGSIDELSAIIGLARSFYTSHNNNLEVTLELIQQDLISIMADIVRGEKIPNNHESLPTNEFIERIEQWGKQYERDLKRTKDWELAGDGGSFEAALHLARTVCRRAERNVLNIPKDYPNPSKITRVYLNRLSDLLYLMARIAKKYHTSKKRLRN